MDRKNYIGILLIILSNYQRILKRVLFFLIYSIFIVVSSLIITLPLWYVATKHSKVYTVTVIFLITVFTTILFIHQLRTKIIDKQKSGMTLSKIILIPVKKIAVFVLFLTVLYGIVYVYTQNLFFLAITLTVCYIFMLGYYFFIYRKIEEHI